MKTASIPSTWLGLFDTWDAAFLIAVAAECDRLKIPHDDYEAVQKVGNRLKEAA